MTELAMFAAGPQPRVSPTVPYEVFAYRTRTGQVVKRIPPAAVPSWERGLNLMGSWSVPVALDTAVISKESLNGVIDPWDWSWCVCQGMAIRQAGPVLGERYSASSGNSTVISGVGLWQFLADQRVSLATGRSSVNDTTSPSSDIPFGPGATSSLGTPIPALNQGLNLRGIAKRLVAIALAEAGGDLPIDLPTDGTFTGNSVRDYPGYDADTVGERLLNLTQVTDGPEIEFVPYFTDENRQTVRHRMMIGSPRLGIVPGVSHVWRSGQGLESLDFSLDGSSKVRRYWERGSGMDRNVRTGFSQDLTGVTSGSGLLPLLERIGTTHSSTESLEELGAYATQVIQTQTRGSLVLFPTVRINGTDGSNEDSGSPHIDNVTPGSQGVLQVRSHPRLPDGDYAIRIMRMRGSGASSVTLDVA